MTYKIYLIYIIYLFNLLIIYAYIIGDAPWWKQLLAAIGLGGLPVMLVLVALVVIFLLIVIAVIVILLLFVCKNRYIKPGNGVSGGRQKCKCSMFHKNIYKNIPIYVPIRITLLLLDNSVIKYFENYSM